MFRCMSFYEHSRLIHHFSGILKCFEKSVPKGFGQNNEKLKINKRSKTNVPQFTPIKKVTFLDNYEDASDVTEKVNHENNNTVKN